MDLLLFLKKESGSRQKKSRISPDTHTVSAGVLLSRVLVSFPSTSRKALSRKLWSRLSVVQV